MKKFFGHLKTVLIHKHIVFIHSIKAGIPMRGFMHDFSKFAPSEFIYGVKYYTNGKKSPNENERANRGYSSAWMHHKGRNKHHFEYWTDYSPIEKRVTPIKMKYIYLIEMFCDRVAASKVYQGDNYTNKHPLEYFLRGKPNRIIHPVTSDELEKLLIMLAENGEKYTFNYIRKNKKYNEKTYSSKLY